MQKTIVVWQPGKCCSLRVYESGVRCDPVRGSARWDGQLKRDVGGCAGAGMHGNLHCKPPQKGGIEKGGTYERDCYIEKG